MQGELFPKEIITGTERGVEGKREMEEKLISGENKIGSPVIKKNYTLAMLL